MFIQACLVITEWDGKEDYFLSVSFSTWGQVKFVSLIILEEIPQESVCASFFCVYMCCRARAARVCGEVSRAQQEHTGLLWGVACVLPSGIYLFLSKLYTTLPTLWISHHPVSISYHYYAMDLSLQRELYNGVLRGHREHHGVKHFSGIFSFVICLTKFLLCDENLNTSYITYHFWIIFHPVSVSFCQF